MSSQTDTFDLLFQEKQELQETADTLQDSIDFYQSRIDRLEAKPTTAFRASRIESFTESLNDLQADLDFANDSITGYNELLPQDEFDFSFEQSTNSRGRDVVTAQFTVNDSIYDDTYEGGDPLVLEVTGSWREAKYRRGRFRGFRDVTKTARYTIDSEGPVDSEGNYLVGSQSMARIFANASDVTVSLMDGMGRNSDIVFSDTFSANDVEILA